MTGRIASFFDDSMREFAALWIAGACALVLVFSSVAYVAWVGHVTRRAACEMTGDLIEIILAKGETTTPGPDQKYEIRLVGQLRASREDLAC